MSRSSVLSPLDPTPDRPTTGVGAPSPLLAVELEVEYAHLGNPLVAIARLLASEAEAVARVTGDEHHVTVTVALPDDSDETAERAEAWVRWAAHNAGVRGQLTSRRQRGAHSAAT